MDRGRLRSHQHYLPNPGRAVLTDGAESLSSRLNPVESQQLPDSPGVHILINNLEIILEWFAFVIYAPTAMMSYISKLSIL